LKFAICNETFGDWPLDKALQLAAQHGYTGWEVAPFMLTDDVASFDKRQRQAYRDQVEAAGLQIIGLHWLLAKTTGFHLTTLDESVRNATADYFAKLAELCRDLGGQVMVLGSPQQRNYPESQTGEQAMEAAADCLQPNLFEVPKRSEHHWLHQIALAADSEVLIHVSNICEIVGNELLARHFAHRGDDRILRDAVRSKLTLDHVAPGNGEIHGTGTPPRNLLKKSRNENPNKSPTQF